MSDRICDYPCTTCDSVELDLKDIEIERTELAPGWVTYSISPKHEDTEAHRILENLYKELN